MNTTIQSTMDPPISPSEVAALQSAVEAALSPIVRFPSGIFKLVAHFAATRIADFKSDCKRLPLQQTEIFDVDFDQGLRAHVSSRTTQSANGNEMFHVGELYTDHLLTRFDVGAHTIVALCLLPHRRVAFAHDTGVGIQPIPTKLSRSIRLFAKINVNSVKAMHVADGTLAVFCRDRLVILDFDCQVLKSTNLAFPFCNDGCYDAIHHRFVLGQILGNAVTFLKNGQQGAKEIATPRLDKILIQGPWLYVLHYSAKKSAMNTDDKNRIVVYDLTTLQQVHEVNLTDCSIESWRLCSNRIVVQALCKTTLTKRIVFEVGH